MVDITWDDSLSIGHKLLDYQHQTFLELIQELSHVIDRNANRQIVLRHLFNLQNYADYHFKEEERLMDQVSFPDNRAHIEQHAMLLTNLSYQMNKYMVNELNAEELIGFIADWFVLHVKDSDKKLADFLKAK